MRQTPGSAADKAGLRGVTRSAEGLVPGDVIVAVEGKPVTSVAQLLARLDDYRVGDTVRVTLRRGEDIREVAVTLQPGV